MSALLGETGVVVRIAQNLSVSDYLSFSQTNELVSNTLKVLLDEEYFKERIKNLLITFDPESSGDLLVEHAATYVLHVTRTSDPKSTVFVVCLILNPYLHNLDSSDTGGKSQVFAFCFD